MILIPFRVRSYLYGVDSATSSGLECVRAKATTPVDSETSPNQDWSPTNRSSR